MLVPPATDNVIFSLCITIGGLFLYQLLFFVLKRWSRTKNASVFVVIKNHLYGPGFLLMLLLTLLVDLIYIRDFFPPKVYTALRHGLEILTIVMVAVVLIQLITVFREILLMQYKHKSHGEFSLRKANTKFILIQRVLNVLIFIAATAVILMTFNGVKQIGSSLLASAGVVGLILGFAAQKSLGTLFAGIQIAISQPIRLDDVVVVEDRFGTIGEISLTYVTVNVWDGSRLIVPINYFLEKPFENWTRVSSEVIGKVKIYADYTLPVNEIRTVFLTWIAASELWDKRSAGLAVTSANERTIEIRATMSAKNSSDAFDLECMIREKLVDHINQHYPGSLPQTRVVNKHTEEKK